MGTESTRWPLAVLPAPMTQARPDGAAPAPPGCPPSHQHRCLIAWHLLVLTGRGLSSAQQRTWKATAHGNSWPKPGGDSGTFWTSQSPGNIFLNGAGLPIIGDPSYPAWRFRVPALGHTLHPSSATQRTSLVPNHLILRPLCASVSPPGTWGGEEQHQAPRVL